MWSALSSDMETTGTKEKNFLWANNTGCDLRAFDSEITASLKATGALPEELADIFTATLVNAADGNPDGSPRYIINAA